MHRLALLFGLLAALGCEYSSPVVWRSPVANAQLTWMPVDLVFDYPSEYVIAGTLRVTLNGNDVTSLFTLGAPVNGKITAHASDVWGPGLVAPGANVLHAEVGYPNVVYTHDVSFTTSGDPYADGVAAFVPGAQAGFGQAGLPGVVLGPPLGAGVFGGGLDVVSLGVSGRIDVSFTNNVLVNGAGVDFTVFENPFLQVGAFSITAAPFAEPARVSVSQDGVSWHTFPCAMTTAPWYAGCAGIFPVLSNANNLGTPHASVPTSVQIQSLVGVSAIGFVLPAGAGGDSFDLQSVGLGWARFVRIEASASATGPEGADNARFDLDALAAVNSAPATDANGNGIPDAVE